MTVLAVEAHQRLLARAAVIRAVRAFFDGRRFIEVDTPVALTSLAPEPHIEAPCVELWADGRRQRRFLQTSPELPMKRLLALGLPRIYQIAAVFRDGDFTSAHRPEFRMLEWYRRDAGWQTLLDDCEGLVCACADAVGLARQLTYAGKQVDLTPPFARLSVDEAFRRWAGFSILDCLELEALRARVRAGGWAPADDDSWDDLFHRVYLARIEPQLAREPQPVFLTHFPAPLAALARTASGDPRVSERFELFVAGVELANGFGELTDADEQRRRFARDRTLRLAAGRADYPLDERFLAALSTLPPSAGIALGVERLLMLLFDVADIDAVAFIPWNEA